jgi:hypothetical protein
VLPPSLPHPRRLRYDARGAQVPVPPGAQCGDVDSSAGGPERPFAVRAGPLSHGGPVSLVLLGSRAGRGHEPPFGARAALRRRWEGVALDRPCCRRPGDSGRMNIRRSHWPGRFHRVDISYRCLYSYKFFYAALRALTRRGDGVGDRRRGTGGADGRAGAAAEPAHRRCRPHPGCRQAGDCLQGAARACCESPACLATPGTRSPSLRPGGGTPSRVVGIARVLPQALGPGRYPHAYAGDPPPCDAPHRTPRASGKPFRSQHWLEKPHHRRSQGASSFREKLSTGIRPVDPGVRPAVRNVGRGGGSM